VVIGQIEMTWLEMVDFWILWIGEVTNKSIILVLVLIGIIIIIVIILTGGVIGDTF